MIRANNAHKNLGDVWIVQLDTSSIFLIVIAINVNNFVTIVKVMIYAHDAFKAII
jgi:hypothetical protein